MKRLLATLLDICWLLAIVAGVVLAMHVFVNFVLWMGL